MKTVIINLEVYTLRKWSDEKHRFVYEDFLQQTLTKTVKLPVVPRKSGFLSLPDISRDEIRVEKVLLTASFSSVSVYSRILYRQLTSEAKKLIYIPA